MRGSGHARALWDTDGGPERWCGSCALGWYRIPYSFCVPCLPKHGPVLLPYVCKAQQIRTGKHRAEVLTAEAGAHRQHS
jgi:hypothetical protein